MFQLASLFKRLNVLLEFRPARKAVLSGDLKLRIGEGRGRACRKFYLLRRTSSIQFKTTRTRGAGASAV